MKNILVATLAIIFLFGPALEASDQQMDKSEQHAVTGSGPAGSDYSNNLGMNFKLIPAGTFVMGSPGNESGRCSDESQHQVTLSRSFYMQTTEVTQGQWQAVMGSNKSNFLECGLDCPVERVSWEEVQDFIAKLNQLSGLKYRLPTEAEFEYAARAGTTGALASGELTEVMCEEDKKMNEIGWYCGNANGKTHPVGLKKANAWGLYDMHGNLWEWCQDSWDGAGYSTDPVIDPLGTKSTDGRVIRGGSWNDYAWRNRSANRDWCVFHYRNEWIGFRLALSL